MTLMEEDHEVSVFHDGAKGLAAIEKDPPDIALLDVNLPSLSGFDIAESVRANAALKAMPILMLTAQSDLDSRLRGLASADDYLNKPFDPEELEARVAALLRRSNFSAVPAAKPVTELVGETIRHYKVLEEIGQGSMAIVYKALDSKLDRTVALKFFTRKLKSSDKEGRFIREAQAASRLEHPNICTVYTVDETVHGDIFMVMPNLEGETLENAMHRGPLKVSQAFNIAVQTGRGLARAHHEGIIHRDVKPANIFLEKSGTVKMLDFGVAKWRVEDMEQSNLTQPGTLIGTLNYMAPEQVMGKGIDQRVDIWALGVVFYEMLTGEKPFKGALNLVATIRAITSDKPVPIRELRPKVPAKLEACIMKALQKDPSKRYASMDAFLKDLSSLTQKPSS